MTPCLVTNDPNWMAGLSAQLGEVKHRRPDDPGAKYGLVNFSLWHASLQFLEFQESLNKELDAVKLQIY